MFARTLLAVLAAAGVVVGFGMTRLATRIVAWRLASESRGRPGGFLPACLAAVVLFGIAPLTLVLVLRHAVSGWTAESTVDLTTVLLVFVTVGAPLWLHTAWSWRLPLAELRYFRAGRAFVRFAPDCPLPQPYADNHGHAPLTADEAASALASLPLTHPALLGLSGRLTRLREAERRYLALRDDAPPR